MSATDPVRLEELGEGLLRPRPPRLGPGDGDEAFRQHKLLTATIHRAVHLDAMGSESETRAWIRYFREHFPAGRKSDDDAKLLFKDWRTHLLKHDSPGPMVTITHGQSGAHWRRDSQDRLCIDLESMWDDYAQSVDSLIDYLKTHPDRAEVALMRWAETIVTVQPLDLPAYSFPVSGATAMGSATAGQTKT